MSILDWVVLTVLGLTLINVLLLTLITVLLVTSRKTGANCRDNLNKDTPCEGVTNMITRINESSAVNVIFDQFRNRETGQKESALKIEVTANGITRKHAVVLQEDKGPEDLSHSDILIMLQGCAEGLLEILKREPK